MNQGTTMCFHDTRKDIEYCSRYGFEAIELKYRLMQDYDQMWVKELLYKNKIRAGSIGAVQLPILQDEEGKRRGEERLRNLCQCAYMLQSEYIIMIPPRCSAATEGGRIAEDAVNILDRYSDIAEEYHVKLALEVMGFCDSYIRTIRDGLQIIHETGKRNLGIVYDFYHALGMEDSGQAILEAKPEEIFIVHVNDGRKCIAGEYIDEDRLWPYDGDVDINGQMDMLLRVGYHGPFSMEVYQPRGWTFGMQECYRIAWDRMKEMEEKKGRYGSGLE